MALPSGASYRAHLRRLSVLDLLLNHVRFMRCTLMIDMSMTEESFDVLSNQSGASTAFTGFAR